jgi:hypothetical protein
LPTSSPARRQIAARIGGIEKHNGPTDPRLGVLRVQLAAEQLAEGLESSAAQLRDLAQQIGADAPAPGGAS